MTSWTSGLYRKSPAEATLPTISDIRASGNFSFSARMTGVSWSRSPIAPGLMIRMLEKFCIVWLKSSCGGRLPIGHVDATAPDDALLRNILLFRQVDQHLFCQLVPVQMGRHVFNRAVDDQLGVDAGRLVQLHVDQNRPFRSQGLLDDACRVSGRI